MHDVWLILGVLFDFGLLRISLEVEQFWWNLEHRVWAWMQKFEPQSWDLGFKGGILALWLGLELQG